MKTYHTAFLICTDHDTKINNNSSLTHNGKGSRTNNSVIWVDDLKQGAEIRFNNDVVRQLDEFSTRKFVDISDYNEIGSYFVSYILLSRL